VAQGVEARTFRKTKSAEQQRNHGRNRVGPERSPVRVSKDQIEVRAIVKPVLLTEFILALPMDLQSGECGLGTFTSRGLSVFVPLNSNNCVARVLLRDEHRWRRKSRETWQCTTGHLRM